MAITRLNELIRSGLHNANRDATPDQLIMTIIIFPSASLELFCIKIQKLKRATKKAPNECLSVRTPKAAKVQGHTP
jgi:hypothetical protein